MSGVGPKRPNTYDGVVAPANYVPGLGRGARGFVTQSDIGPADAVESTAQGVMADAVSAAQGEDGTFDNFTGFQSSLFGNTPYDEDDKDADSIYKKIDERMEERRSEKREMREEEQAALMKKEHMDVHRQFEDLKRELKSISMEEWNNLPDIEDRSLKRKRDKSREIYTPVPDTVIEARRMQNSMETYLDPRQQVMGGFDTPSDANSVSLSAAREKMLTLKLDRMSDSVSGQTVIDPRGYITSLNSMKTASEAEVGDIKKARITFRSMIQSNPSNPQGWIAAARLEEQAGKPTAARKLIREGCEKCPLSEDVWLEAAHLQDGDNAKIILANAVVHISRSVRIWQEAADLEEDADKKRRVLWRALEYIPNSVVLWKQAVSLEKEESAMLMLQRAVEQVPECVELWLALAKLQSYKEARETLNRARKAVPTEPLIWFTGAQLEEANGNIHRVDTMIEKALKSLRNNEVIIERDKWLQHAYNMERAGAPQTCGAIVRNVLDIGVELEDRRRTWMLDAEKALHEGAIETAKAIFAFTLSTFPNHQEIWQKAYEVEDDFGTVESAESLLQQAVQACPASEALWLLLIQHKYAKASDSAGARAALEEAMHVNASNQEFISSEKIWLTAYQIEWEANETDRARAILERARVNCKSQRVWLKTALLEWESDNAEAEEKTLKYALELFPSFDKLFIMLAQLYESQNRIDMARETYRLGGLRCVSSPALWIQFIRFSKRYDPVQRVRTIAESARAKCSTDDDIWIECIRFERSLPNNDAAAKLVLAMARQNCPKSGRVWAESIVTVQQKERRTYVSLALKEKGDDPYVVMAAGKLFWSMRKHDKARNWIQRAISINSDIGDFWAIWYIFELQNGNHEQQEDVVKKCTKAKPKHGEVWTSIRKQKENLRKSSFDILRIVADQMKENVIDGF